MILIPPMDQWPDGGVRDLLRNLDNPPQIILRSSVAKIKEMRAAQKAYFLYRKGSEIPRMRLLELDVDRILARLPEEGKPGDIAYVLDEDVRLLRDMRDIQRRFVQDKSTVSIGECCVLETRVDKLIACLTGDVTEEMPLPFWAGLDGE